MRFVFICSILFLALPANAAIESQAGGDIRYLSGGVGEEERAMIESQQGQYDIKVLLADTTGHLVGSADIRVLDRDDNEVLATTTDGPILLIDLPPGTYTVEAMAEGKVQRRTVRVTGKGTKNVHFSWQGITDRDGMNEQMSAR